VIGVLHRYTEALQANGGKLVLAGVSPALRDQLQRTGILGLISEENLFSVTQTIGDSGNVALEAAKEWMQEGSSGEDQTEKDGVPEGAV
jgi:SulP family sulfate permease